MSKKEKVLYMTSGKKYDVIVTHKINITYSDSANIIKCNEKLCDMNCICLKRVTKRFSLFGKYIYFNTLFGGIIND